MNDVTHRNTELKEAALKVLLGYVKQGYMEVPATMLRASLDKTGISKRPDSLMRSIYTMETEGLVKTKRVLDNPDSRKIVITISLTKFGADRACAAMLRHLER
ncbi:hypothetical protein C1T06_22660 [Vibrio parahaemolyticus]|nr:hypothetical protein C1T06_22660 [Vibrio parahaemolyticus]